MKVKDMPPGTDTSLGDELIASLKEGMAILRGDVQPARLYPAASVVDVRAIRSKLGLTQQAFAKRYGFGLATIRDWEQGRSQPDQAGRSYLLVIEREPETVWRALEAAGGMRMDAAV